MCVGVCRNLPMQVLKVAAMASTGMQSTDVEGSVAKLVSGGDAGISMLLICGLLRGGWEGC